MSLFYPDYSFKRINDIPAGFFAQRGITTLLIDVDNTLSGNNSPEVKPEVTQWLEMQRSAGLRMLIISNNSLERVASFAGSIGLEYIANAQKPLGKIVRLAMRDKGFLPKETAIIGDQIFTDILCGKNVGCITVLVEPFELEGYGAYRVKRVLERPVLRGYKRYQKRRGTV